MLSQAMHDTKFNYTKKKNDSFNCDNSDVMTLSCDKQIISHHLDSYLEMSQLLKFNVKNNRMKSPHKVVSTLEVHFQCMF